VKRSRKHLPKKYVFTAFRPILLGIEDVGVLPEFPKDHMILLKLLTIGEDTETFRKRAVPQKQLKKYLEDELVRIPEGKMEDVAGILMQEKLEAGEGKEWL